MSVIIEDDDLVRYLDGELDAEAIGAVEAALAQDAVLRARLATLSEGTALLRAAFSAPQHGAASDHLTDKIASMLAAAERTSISVAPTPRATTGRRWLLPVAVAASIAVLAAGIGGGFLASDARLAGELARIEAVREKDRLAFETALQMALETQTSGTSVAWEGAGTGTRGTITPVRTFKSADGQWCREYSVAPLSDGAAERQHAVACRAPEGHWKVRLPVLIDS